jgi:uncharacterized protein (DUF305 family)
MSQGRLDGSRVRPGWQQLLVTVTLGAVLVAALIGPALVSGPAGDADQRGDALAESTSPWNTADATYVQAMVWHSQQARQLASLVQRRTTRPELRRLARGTRTAQRHDVAKLTAWLRTHDATDSWDDAGTGPWGSPDFSEGRLPGAGR